MIFIIDRGSITRSEGTACGLVGKTLLCLLSYIILHGAERTVYVHKRSQVHLSEVVKNPKADSEEPSGSRKSGADSQAVTADGQTFVAAYNISLLVKSEARRIFHGETMRWLFKANVSHEL